MHVWIVNHFALTPDQPGGTRHFELAKELGNRDIDVTIIGASRQHISNQDHIPSGAKWAREKIKGVRFHWIKTPSSSPGYFARVWNNVVFAASVVRRRGLADMQSPDVVVGTSPDLISALSAYIVSRFLGVPFILEIRDVWPLSIVQIGLLSEYHPVVFLLALVERFLYRRANWIVTLLPGAHKHIVQLGGDNEKITWIPNGITIGEQDAAYASDAGPDGDFVLMYAGSHGNANNLDSLLEAAVLLKQQGKHQGLKIRMVGDGPQKQALMRSARKLGLDFVVFEPAVPKSEIGGVLAEADAFCLVFYSRSIYDLGMSANKLFDYFAAGRPIIMAFDANYNPVKEADAGVTVPAEDAASLAQAICDLRETSADRRREMGQNAQAYVNENHSMKMLGGEFAELVKLVVSRSKGVS